MKLIKLLVPIFVINTSIFCMDTEQKQVHNEREQTLLAALHKLPKANLTQEQLHERLPAVLQHYIAKFVPGNNKLPIYFPKELIPALMQFSSEPVHMSNPGTFISRTITVEPEYYSLLELLDLNEKRLKDFYAQHKPAPSTKPYIIGQTRFFISKFDAFGLRINRDSEIGIPTHHNRVCSKLKNQLYPDESNFEDKGFTSHIYSDGEILFKLHWHKHSALLKRLSSQQLDYISSLYDLHKKGLKERQAIKLDKRQVEIHLSLPAFIQYNLESNYTIAPITALRRKEYCKRAIYAGLLALPIAAGIMASTIAQS